jgi:hypothetical protein
MKVKTLMTRILGLEVRLGVVALIAATAVGVSSAGAATAEADAGCTTVVKAASWTIKSLGSGSNYTLRASGMSCAIARAWVVKFSHETATDNTLKGPAGFKCESTASQLSGDTHVYDGVCQKGKPTSAIFVWAPKP